MKRGFMGSIWLGAPGARWITRKDTIEIRKRVQSFRQHARAKNGSTGYSVVSSGRKGGGPGAGS